MIDFDDLYSLAPSHDPTVGRLKCAVRYTTGAVKDLFRARSEIVPQLVRSNEDKFRDFVGCSHVGIKVVSTAFIDVLAHHAFNGYKSYPIDVSDSSLNGYCGLAVVGVCGPRIPDRSKRVSPNMSLYRGYIFDESTWDGSDIFSPEGTTLVFMTGDVVRSLQEAGISGCEFTPLTQLEIWDG